MFVFHRSLLLALLLLPVVSSAGEISDKLANLLSSDNRSPSDEILDPEIAFKIEIDQSSDQALIMSWEIEPGYYLYKDKFSIASNVTAVNIGNVNYPKGKLKQDPLFGEVEVYYGEDSASVPVTASDSSVTELVLEVGYQGCKEDAICYPPIKKEFIVPVSFDPQNNVSRSQLNNTLSISEQDAITQKLKDKNLLLNILAFFGFGFLLALTPCVFPMIPILSGIIVGEGEKITRSRAMTLSLTFVFTMALTYAVLGIVAGLFHINLQAASQNIWVISLFSIVFIALALSMFGFYELQLPPSWQTRLSGQSKGGTLKGAAVMGCLSAIIVGPCVAPPLAGALLYISQTGDAVLGGLALFAMGLGFGLPLLLVGATSGELLPRAGQWMDTVKKAFGIIMLGVAIWFLERIFPASLTLLLWATLFICTAIFMGALDSLDASTSSMKKLGKGLGIVILVYGIILVFAATKGNGTLLKPFNTFSVSGTSVNQQVLPFTYISSVEELNQQLDLAKQSNKNVMLDFYADWCVVCIELEQYTFIDNKVQDSLSEMVLLKADVTENNDQDKTLLKSFDLFGPPAILFFNKDADEITSHRLVGFINAEDFVQHIETAKRL